MPSKVQGRYSSLITTGSRHTVYCVALSFLLAVRLESFVENDISPRSMTVKGEGEEHFRRHSLKTEPGGILEPERPVVLRVCRNAASRGSECLQSRQSLSLSGRALVLFVPIKNSPEAASYEPALSIK